MPVPPPRANRVPPMNPQDNFVYRRNPAKVFVKTTTEFSARVGHERNPWSDGLRAHYDEILTVAMLLGEETPIICSCCIGTGANKGIFGGPSACGQCRNTGYDWIGVKTLQHFTRKREHKEPT